MSHDKLSDADLRQLDTILFDYLRTNTRGPVGLHPGVVDRLERLRDRLRNAYGATGPREVFGKVQR